MKKLFEARKEFNKAFEIENSEVFDLIPDSDYLLEYDMLKEEIDEYREACDNGDLVAILDAIIDIQYLLIGTAYKHGVTAEMMEDAYMEVHRSNMTKLHNGKVIKNSNGKVIKPSTFSPPNLEDFVF